MRGALSPDEVARLRTLSLDAVATQGLLLGNGRVIPNAAVRVPELRWLVAHPAIVGAVSEAAGSPVQFTFEADIHKNFIVGKWHKDTGEQVMPRGYFDLDDPFDRDDCRVVKVGIYLQDHTKGGGLTVRPGSHRTSALDAGHETPVLTEAGDLVLFDVRISHRGVRPNLLDKAVYLATRILPAARRASAVDAVRERLMALRHQSPRVAVYLAYGIPNPQTTTFASRNHRRQQTQTGGDDPAHEQELAAELAEHGLPTVDLIPA